MIFISHNYQDKPLVEQVALRLANVFGKDKVFYDSWSIQPGEGIIDRMNAGLKDCTHFFFFVSENSLKSKMVSLEWQNGLLRATQRKCKLVAVRCDQSELPPIMTQSLYIDLFSVGLDAAIAQINDVVRGASTYREPTKPFSNLCFTKSGSTTDLVIEIKAKHYLEPIGRFLVMYYNEGNEISVSPIDEDPYIGGYESSIHIDGLGRKVNGNHVGIYRGITPSMPLQIKVEARPGHILKIAGVLHQQTPKYWASIPEESPAFPAFGTTYKL